MFHSAAFDTRISISTVIDSPEVLYDPLIAAAIILSLATLVYIDNDWLNVYNRSLERLVLVRKLVLRRRYAYRVSATLDASRV